MNVFSGKALLAIAGGLVLAAVGYRMVAKPILTKVGIAQG